MRLLEASRARAHPPDAPDHFGGNVFIQDLHQTQESMEIEVLAVFFEPGARTVPHTHATGQLLLIVEGEAIVATEDERRRFRTGDLVHIPAGRWHWHGATPDSAMCHLSIRPGGGSSWPPDVPFRDWDTYPGDVRADR